MIFSPENVVQMFFSPNPSLSCATTKSYSNCTVLTHSSKKTITEIVCVVSGRGATSSSSQDLLGFVLRDHSLRCLGKHMQFQARIAELSAPGLSL